MIIGDMASRQDIIKRLFVFYVVAFVVYVYKNGHIYPKCGSKSPSNFKKLRL